MVKTILTVDGRSCSMCEAHLNDSIRKAFPEIKKVTSSHSKGETVIVSDAELDANAIRAAVDPTGYKVLNVKNEPYQKKGLFGLFG